MSIIFSNIKAIALLRGVSYSPVLEGLSQMCIPPSLRELARELRVKFETSEGIVLDDLQDLPYSNAVLKEEMRLCP